ASCSLSSPVRSSKTRTSWPLTQQIFHHVLLSLRPTIVNSCPWFTVPASPYSVPGPKRTFTASCLTVSLGTGVAVGSAAGAEVSPSAAGASGAAAEVFASRAMTWVAAAVGSGVGGCSAAGAVGVKVGTNGRATAAVGVGSSPPLPKRIPHPLSEIAATSSVERSSVCRSLPFIINLPCPVVLLGLHPEISANRYSG